MTDVFTKEKRSHIMSRVRGHGNKQTELALASLFRRNHITGWRRQQPLFGKPDFVFPRLKLAVFVDGCFWHVCPLHAEHPRNNRAFWLKKLASNQARDKKVNRTLRKQGWRVLRIWEHELTGQRPSCLRKLQRILKEPPPAPTSHKLPMIQQTTHSASEGTYAALRS